MTTSDEPPKALFGIALAIIALSVASIYLDWLLMTEGFGVVFAPMVNAEPVSVAVISYAFFTEVLGIFLIGYFLLKMGLRKTAIVLAPALFGILALEFVFPDAVRAIWRAIFG